MTTQRVLHPDSLQSNVDAIAALASSLRSLRRRRNVDQRHETLLAILRFWDERKSDCADWGYDFPGSVYDAAVLMAIRASPGLSFFAGDAGLDVLVVRLASGLSPKAAHPFAIAAQKLRSIPPSRRPAVLAELGGIHGAAYGKRRKSRSQSQ
jgi:hypothetical protein